jgi:hypothetical protein
VTVTPLVALVALGSLVVLNALTIRAAPRWPHPIQYTLSGK